jgi:NAD(P)-dependent dehydrogenase (short-subunit alcohol dehydrogenase family)
MLIDLSGKTALVSGASRGIGRAIALALAEAGADVALTARHLPELEQLASEVEAQGRRAIGLACDITQAEQVSRLPQELEARFQPIDILVNSAGIAESHKFLDHPDDLWQRHLEINLTGTYRMCKAFAPSLAARGWGRIINIASTAGKVGGRYTAAYSASKHGVLGLTRSLALELVAYNITVNAVCPGYVDTSMTARAIRNIVERTGRTEQQARAALEEKSPQKRLIAPEEVAALVVLLASDSARGINGQAINLDGGQVMD